MPVPVAVPIIAAASAAVVGIIKLFTPSDKKKVAVVEAKIADLEKDHNTTKAGLAAAKAKLETEKESHETTRANYENTEKMMQQDLVNLGTNHKNQMNQIQADSNKKISDLEDERKKAAEKFESDKEARDNASREERKQMTDAYNQECRVKDDAKAKLIDDQKKAEEKLREKHEEERKNIEAQLAAEKDKRLEEEKAHSAKVEEIHKEVRELEATKNKQILALTSFNELLRRTIMEAQFRNAQNSIRMIHNLENIHTNEKNSTRLKKKIQEMLGVISNMEKLRRQFVEQLVNLRRHNTSEELLETVQVTLQSIEEEISKLEDMINSTISLIDDSSFARDRIEEAKKHLNSALIVTSALYDEIIEFKSDIEDVPISRDAMKKCLEELRHAITSIPSMITQTMNECIEEQKANVEIQSHQEMANLENIAISAVIEAISAVEMP